MRISYICEVCGTGHHNEGSALRCELTCTIAKCLCLEISDSPNPIGERWTPPPVVDARNWKEADQRELARRVIHALKGIEDKVKHLNQTADLPRT